MSMPSLRQWLVRTYAQSRQVFPTRHSRKPGRKWFKPAQSLAAALLMERLDLSCRGACQLLAAKSELRQALRMRHIPSYGFYHRATRLLRQARIDQEGTEPAADRLA